MNNKYGYQVDITNPKYRELYERYKKYKNIPKWCPLSDVTTKVYEIKDNDVYVLSTEKEEKRK